MSNNQLQLPIQINDALIFDSAFSSMREKFMTQMRLIDEEMTKFCKSIGPQGQSVLPADTDRSEVLSYDYTDSPLIDGEGENRTLKLQFDMSQFDPSEVSVSILDNKLVVSATHEERADNSVSLRNYHREFHFPEGVSPETVVSSLSKDGVLIVKAPLPAIAN